MTKDAPKLLRKEIAIFLAPIRPNFFFKRITRSVKFNAAAKVVAKAKPQCWSGSIRMATHPALTTNAKKATFTGVLVSCRE